MPEKSLVERLLIKASVMESGERIAWGSDTSLMREAAEKIAKMQKRINVQEAVIQDLTEKLARVSAPASQTGESIL